MAEACSLLDASVDTPWKTPVTLQNATGVSHMAGTLRIQGRCLTNMEL